MRFFNIFVAPPVFEITIRDLKERPALVQILTTMQQAAPLALDGPVSSEDQE